MNFELRVTEPRKGRTFRRRLHKAKSDNPFCVDSERFNVSLLKWLSENDWKPQTKMRLADFTETGRGLMATTNISSGDMLVKIPIQVMITPELVLAEDELGPALLRSEIELTSVDLLTYFVIWEVDKDEKSKWFYYLNCLPEHTDNFSLTEDERNILPVFMQEEFNKKNTQLIISYKKFRAIIKKSGIKVEDDFHRFEWSYNIVNTRCVYYKKREYGTTVPINDHSALVPYLDFLNHSPNAKVDARFNDITQCFEITTKTPYSKYSQVFINYGQHDNLKLVTEYGFCIPNNIDDFVPVFEWEIMKFLDKEYKRIVLLKRKDLVNNLYVTHEGLSWNLSVIIQTLSMTEDDVKAGKYMNDYIETMNNDEVNTYRSFSFIEKLLSEKLEYLLSVLNQMSELEHISLTFHACSLLLKCWIKIIQQELSRNRLISSYRFTR